MLVAGGAGAVGNAAIQLARWSDATVITTVSSPAKANLAARAGADHVIDYRRQDVVAEVRAIAPHGVNTIVEVSPAVNAALDAEVLARHGSVAVYANNGGSEMELPVRPSMVPNVRWQFVLVYNAPEDWRARGAGGRRRGRAGRGRAGRRRRPGCPCTTTPSSGRPRRTQPSKAQRRQGAHRRRCLSQQVSVVASSHPVPRESRSNR